MEERERERERERELEREKNVNNFWYANILSIRRNGFRERIGTRKGTIYRSTVLPEYFASKIF